MIVGGNPARVIRDRFHGDDTARGAGCRYPS
jgi:acetyltransferase-like isoleucine patch superfamily enzyme